MLEKIHVELNAGPETLPVQGWHGAAPRTNLLRLGLGCLDPEELRMVYAAAAELPKAMAVDNHFDIGECRRPAPAGQEHVREST